MHCSTVHFFYDWDLYTYLYQCLHSVLDLRQCFFILFYFNNLYCHNLKTKMSWFQFRIQDLEFQSAKSKNILKICNQTQRSTQNRDEKDDLTQQLWLTTESDRTPTLNIKVEDGELLSDYGTIYCNHKYSSHVKRPEICHPVSPKRLFEHTEMFLFTLFTAQCRSHAVTYKAGFSLKESIYPS